MEIVSLVISVVALVIAVAAFMRTGGIQELQTQVKAMTPKKDDLRTKTADALDRLGRAVRGPREGEPPSTPAATEKETEEREKDERE
ncbi:MAG: hypothetical protein ACE5K9_01740 [Candidatus Methylomirabilales bacterium]